MRGNACLAFYGLICSMLLNLMTNEEGRGVTPFWWFVSSFCFLLTALPAGLYKPTHSRGPFLFPTCIFIHQFSLNLILYLIFYFMHRSMHYYYSIDLLGYSIGYVLLKLKHNSIFVWMLWDGPLKAMEMCNFVFSTWNEGDAMGNWQVRFADWRI